MNLHIVQCKIGSTASEKIRAEEVGFFKWLASSITDTKVEFVHSVPQRTIAIPNEAVLQGGRIAYSLIQNCFDQVTLFNTGDILVFDIEVHKISQLRAHLLVHIITAIMNGLTLRRESGIPNKCIIILEDLPPEKDLVNNCFDSLEKIFKNKEDLILLDEYGRNNRDICIDSADFRRQRIISKQNPRVAIHQKMIRQLGHFKKTTSSGETCVRQFYDGQYCVKEIRDFLYLELHDQIDSDAIICYHAKRSPWLVESVMSLKNLLQCDFYDVVWAENNTEVDDIRILSGKKLFVVLDFLDTGTALVRFLQKLEKKPARIITILATGKCETELGTCCIRETKFDDINVEYLQKARFKRLGETPCNFCTTLGLPEDTLPTLSITGPIRSIDFWEMALESKLVEEKDPPGYRRPISESINCLKMLSRNGGFIASRVEQLFKEKAFPVDTSIVCPEGEKGSAEFALNIEVMLSKKIIFIPRKIINRFADGDANISHEEKQNEWYYQISSPTVTNCVVIDDILVSGKTLIGLQNILISFEKDIEAFIPLLNLNPKRNDEFSGKMISLYEWQEYVEAAD